MVFHGIAGDAELGGDLVIGQLLFAAEAEYFAGAGRQFVDDAGEELLVFLGEDGVFGRIMVAEDASADFSHGGLAAAGGMEGIDGMVTGDDEQECPEGVKFGQFGALFPDFEEDFLADVLCELGGFDETGDELGEGFLVVGVYF